MSRRWKMYTSGASPPMSDEGVVELRLRFRESRAPIVQYSARAVLVALKVDSGVPKLLENNAMLDRKKMYSYAQYNSKKF